jgi:hypothetical protein
VRMWSLLADHSQVWSKILDEKQLCTRIDELAREAHALFERRSRCEGTYADRERLEHVQVMLAILGSTSPTSRSACSWLGLRRTARHRREDLTVCFE